MIDNPQPDKPSLTVKPSRTRKPKRKRTTAPQEDRVLTHREMAAIYLWRTFEYWAANDTRGSCEALLTWLEKPGNFEMAHELVSHLMVAVGVGLSDRAQSDVTQ